MRILVGQNNVPVEVFSQFALDRLTVKVPGIERALIVRMQETDPEVFTQIFVWNAYKHPFLPSDAKVIIDAGANVGYSVHFFRRRYPNATIIALEPDPANYSVLEENCAHLGNVKLLNAALWNSCTTLSLQCATDSNKELGAWGTRTVPDLSCKGGVVETSAVDVPEIMRLFGIAAIDIFKIDIEGAEREVFFNPAADWYDVTGLFIVETHDVFAPGSDAAVKKALSPIKFDWIQRGENQFFRRI